MLSSMAQKVQRKENIMKKGLCILLVLGMLAMILLLGCGRGGNNGNSNGSTNSDIPCGVGVIITTPSYEDAFTTTSTPVILGGIVEPDFQDVTWRNSGTGGSGKATLYDYTCGFFGCSYDWVAYIPLASGSNQIEVEAFDTAGKLRGRDCVDVNLNASL
jgi:hypothetical protein